MCKLLEDMRAEVAAEAGAKAREEGNHEKQ